MPKTAPKTAPKKSTKKVVEKKEVKKTTNVPIMRCVGQLKNHLNNDTKHLIEEFLEKNKKYSETHQKLTKEIRDAVVYSDPEKKVIDKEKTKVARDEIRKKLSEFNTNNDSITKEIRSLNKKLYRISGSASKYLSAILYSIIENLLNYAIQNVVSQTTPTQKQPKVDITALSNMTLDNSDIYPIVSGLPSLVNIKNLPEKETTKKSRNESQETLEDKEGSNSEGDDKKRGVTYKMVIYNIFRDIIKNRTGDDNQKLCCAVSTREVISDILLEYVERLSNFLEILVGSTAKANTINDDHIINANKLMFKMYPTANYTKFEELVKKSQTNISS